MSSTYATPSSKRQKVRDSRGIDIDYFQGIDKLEFNNMSAIDNLGYKYYSASERVQGRTMEDWMKISVSLTHFRNRDFPSNPPIRPWDDCTNSLDSNKRAFKACLDMCSRIGVKYITAFDSDLIAVTDNYEEYRSNWDEMLEYLQDILSRSHVKFLWIAPDLHSHARFTSGALTNPDVHTITFAAAQIKRCLEMSQRLNCECFALFPKKEKYDAIFKTDFTREMKTFAKLLKMINDYKEKLNYRCQLLLCLEKWDKKGYMWDTTSCLWFLKSYNLERFYKVCVKPGHDMFMANAYNMLGGVTIRDDEKNVDSKNFALIMKSFLQQGSIPPSGISLQLSPSRQNSDLREIMTKYVKFIDAAARGLRVACTIHTEQILAKFVQQRYSTLHGGFGARIVNGECTLEECEEYYKKNQHQSNDSAPSKSEHMDLVFQRYLDNCDQM